MRRTRIIIGALAGLALASPAAAAAPYEPLDPRFWGNIVAAPDPALFTAQETFAYPTGADRLPFTLYRPAKTQKPPVVVIVNGIGDPADDRLMDWAIYKSWGALFAANGIAAVTMAAKPETLDRNLSDLVDHLAARGESLGVDPTRLALFSASANTTVAGRYLTSERGRDASRYGRILLRQRPGGRVAQGQAGPVRGRRGRHALALRRGV